MGAPRKQKKSGSVGSAVTATAPYRGFVKVEREQLDHAMFRGHLDWIGAWLLVQAAADYRTELVNLTDVGRKVARDFGWNNEKWRRFVMRLEKENFVATVEKRNLGDTLGYRHVARILDPKKEQGDMGRDIDALEDGPLVRNVGVDSDDAAQTRSGRGSDGELGDGAVGGVLKEQRARTESVVSSADKGTNTLVDQGDYNDDSVRPCDKFNSETAPTESATPPAPSPGEEINSYAQKARQFFANLVKGNFVEYLEKKINAGDYRQDLFEYWHEEYSSDELKQAWELAQTVQNYRHEFAYGERLTFIDLLNDKIKVTDKAALRIWVRQHKEAKEVERLRWPLHYSDIEATKAFIEVVVETGKLPSVIDIFDKDSFRAFVDYANSDEVKVARRDAAEAFLTEPRERNVYYIINAAPNPKAGVSFNPKYIANSDIFSKDKDELLKTLKKLVNLNLVECLIYDPDHGFVNYRPTDISEWNVPQV